MKTKYIDDLGIVYLCDKLMWRTRFECRSSEELGFTVFHDATVPPGEIFSTWKNIFPFSSMSGYIMINKTNIFM